MVRENDAGKLTPVWLWVMQVNNKLTPVLSDCEFTVQYNVYYTSIRLQFGITIIDFKWHSNDSTITIDNNIISLEWMVYDINYKIIIKKLFKNLKMSNAANTSVCSEWNEIEIIK